MRSSSYKVQMTSYVSRYHWYAGIAYIWVCDRNVIPMQEYQDSDQQPQKTEEPQESEKEVEQVVEEKPLADTLEEPEPKKEEEEKEENVELPPLISTDETDLLVCPYMQVEIYWNSIHVTLICTQLCYIYAGSE